MQDSQARGHQPAGAGDDGGVYGEWYLTFQVTPNDGWKGIVCASSSSALAGQELFGLPVLGAVDHLSAVSHDALIVAIGDNATRQRLFDTLQGQGERFVVARHPSAVIAPDVQIGSGSMICAGVVVNPGSVIGANVILNTGCTVDHHNHIGDHVHIAPGVHLGGDVSIGEGTLVGIGATVMPQRRVGDWSVVSAGALVHADLPDRIVAAGMPARIVRNLTAED